MSTDEIKKIAVIGPGMMGHAIAQEFASAGYEVKLCGRSDERLELALKKIEQNLRELAEWDIISDDEIKPALSRLQTTLSMEKAGSDADLVVESIIEDLEIKQQIFKQLDRICPEHTLLASNTSSLLPTDLGAAGYETMQNLMAGILGGAHMVFECLGVLDAIMTTSYEKLMIDLEIISRVMRIRDGLDTTGKERALESIQKIGHASGYVSHTDTLTNFRNRWRPTLSDWGTYENWLESGSQDVAARANREYKEILKKAPSSLIDPEVDKALQAYIRHAS